MEIRAGDLATVPETTGSRLLRLLLTDLGDPTLVAAVTVARVAADEARAQSVATVGGLERLIPGGPLHDLEGAVRGSGGSGTSTPVPAGGERFLADRTTVVEARGSPPSTRS
jgi:hypothetical protein